jgi:hypothetical protein
VGCIVGATTEQYREVVLSARAPEQPLLAEVHDLQDRSPVMEPFP